LLAGNLFGRVILGVDQKYPEVQGHNDLPVCDPDSAFNLPVDGSNFTEMAELVGDPIWHDTKAKRRGYATAGKLSDPFSQLRS